MPVGFKTVGHHICGRLPLGPNQEHIGQCILMCDTLGTYYPRVVLEPCPTFKEIHILKLARELTDRFTYGKPLKSWDEFKNEKIVFHTVIEENRAYLFVSDIKHDYQIGIVDNVGIFNGGDLAKLICYILNGKDISRFKISNDGNVRMEEG